LVFISLSAGYLLIPVVLFQISGGEWRRVFWEIRGVKKGPIPAEALFQ